jgi:hypothetical protein
MMGGNTASSPTAKPFGVQDQMTSNQQQALPVAYMAGTRKLAVKWMTPVYNLHSKAAPSRTGKK